MAQQRDHIRREQAYWLQFVLSAMTGEKITQAQLLGEEAVDQEARAKQAERDLENLQSRLTESGVASGGMIPVQKTGEVFMG